MTSFLIIDDHPLFRDALGNAIRLAHTDARILEAMSTFGSRGWAQIMSAKGPGCVKTSTRGERAELFSLFSSFDGACQSGSFLIQCHRDKCSTRKFDVGVFTQPGSGADSCGIEAVS